MKKFILLLGVLALGFTSCSKKSENLKVIPKDAMAAKIGRASCRERV